MCEVNSSCEDENVGGRGSYSTISRQQKEMFINQYQEGKTISEAAAVSNLKINTAKTILYKYKRADEEIVIKQRGGKKKEKVTDEILTFLEDLVEQNPYITLKAMKDKLYESHHQINISSQTVANSLKKLKITLKKSSTLFDRLNEENTLDLRRDYALNFTQKAPENHKKIIFLGESGFNFHLRRTSARSSQGTNENLIVPTVRGRNVTLIVAISVDGLIHCNILPYSNCSNAKFCSFIKELLEKIRIKSMRNVWLVVDNSAILKTREVKQLVVSSSAQFVIISPYSPMLNPVEQVFLKVKLAARKILSEARGNFDILDVINEGMQTINRTDCNIYITNMFMKLPQAIDKQQLY